MNARINETVAPPQPGTPQARILIHSGDYDGQVSVSEVMVERGKEPPLHRHRHEDLLVYVLAGHLDFLIDDERFAVAPGACVRVPKGSEHGFAIESEAAHLLIILTPAGAEACLADLYGLTDAEATVSGQTSSEAIDRLVTTAARFGIDITGPPLARESR